MLILSRKQTERIVINENIHLVIVQIRGDRVKLGFEAPNGVPIHRQEIARRIAEEIQPKRIVPAPRGRDMKNRIGT
jgi:carbon storage regulator